MTSRTDANDPAILRYLGAERFILGRVKIMVQEQQGLYRLCRTAKPHAQNENRSFSQSTLAFSRKLANLKPVLRLRFWT